MKPCLHILCFWAIAHCLAAQNLSKKTCHDLSCAVSKSGNEIVVTVFNDACSDGLSAQNISTNLTVTMGRLPPKTVATGKIGNDGSVELRFEVPPSLVNRQFSVVANVDPNNLIKESNEYNNETVQHF